MPDVMSREQRSRVMARNVARDTLPERRLHTLLAVSGLDFTRHDETLAGKPDFVFRAAKLAVFVDGDFWHGWRFPLWKHKLTEYWHEKIARNRHRDRRNFQRLRRLGWRVLRVWEHQIEDDSMKCIFRISEMAGPIDKHAVASAYETLPLLKRRNRLPKP